MRKILVLLKKDLTLDKTNLIIVILVSLGIPIYVKYLFREIGLGEGLDFLSIFFSSLYCIFISYSKLGVIEHKYRGTAYLTLTPITRKDIVASKYMFIFVIFFISIIGYQVSYLFFPSLQPLSITSVAIVWTANILFLSIYIPLEIKVGYDNIKYYFTAVIVAIPFLIGIIGKYKGSSILSIFHKIKTNMLPYTLVSTIILIVVSYCVCIHIFDKKDL